MSPTSTIRLNKFLAEAGLASRRGADALIFAGRVTLNGQTVTEAGTQVRPDRDHVLVDGRPVAVVARAATYIVLHKPVHTVCTVTDPQGRQTVLDLLPKDLRQRRVVPVGRLDYMSEGLLLLTDDGEVTLRLTHPSFEHPKQYEVLVRGTVPEAALQAMRQGLRLAEGEQLAPVKARTQSLPDDKTKLHLTLTQGINRQIRRMCRDLGLTILRLRRVAVGPIQLGDLAPGRWRHLTPDEVRTLKTGLGLTENS